MECKNEFLSFSPSLPKTNFSMGTRMNIAYICKNNIYKNKQNLMHYRCTRNSPLSRTVKFSGVISQTSGQVRSSLHKDENTINKWVNRLFSCFESSHCKKTGLSFLS